jgi:predicted transposase YbfD/YdcC
MSSLPIFRVLDQFDEDEFPDVPAAPDSLLAVLRGVPDPRRKRGIRHPLGSILAVAACAVASGAKSFVAIAEWIAEATPAMLALVGVTGEPPSESTIRRTLQQLDGDGFDAKLGIWSQLRSTTTAETRVIAVDGKSVRGSGRPAIAGGRCRHLLAAFTHSGGLVLGQLNVDAKTNEIPMFSTLLESIDIAGAVITADALHAQRDHAIYLHQRGAHYLLTVKGNQPTLRKQLAAQPWADVPISHTTEKSGHGRKEKRTLKVVTVTAGILFPHAAQAIQITRKIRKLKSRKWRTETVYAVTSLTAGQAQPHQLAAWIRGHWSIENSLHWVRDVTLGEDLSQIRTGSAPQVMASLRNLAINLHRLAGAINIAAALRHQARNPNRPITLLLTS